MPAAQFERRYFLSVAGIGFDAYIVHKLSLGFKLSLGVVAYGLEALRQVLRYSFPTFTCQADGREFRAPFAVVHRTCRYAGWMKLAPGASIFEPRFRLCLFKGRGWARYFLYAAAALARQHLKLPDVELVEATKVICPVPESEKPVYFELDGETAGQLPVTFEVIPSALTLLVP
jgi:diacylglycerol kinase family enzyme